MKGAEHRVHYHPRRPGLCVLKPGSSVAPYAVILSLAAVVLLMLWEVLYHFRP
jgi:hypothetical protein